MASSNEHPGKLYPQKVVIVTGPTFGTAIGLVLFGAAIGAAAVCYLRTQHSGAASGADAVFEGMTGGGAKETTSSAQVMARLNGLAKRVKSLAGRARETMQTAGEVIGPTISEAVSEGKSAARAVCCRMSTAT